MTGRELPQATPWTSCWSGSQSAGEFPSGYTLRLTEKELLTHPCDCMCCYDVNSTVTGLMPGIYTVEYVWEDDEQGWTQHSAVLVVP